MKKDDILAKSRSEKNDEYENKTLKDAQGVGMILVVAICIFFLFANAVVSDLRGLEKGIVSFDYAAILFAYLSGSNFYSFTKLKNKNNLIAGLGLGFAFACTLILYFINV